MSSADLGPIHGPRIPPQGQGQPDDCPGTLPLRDADQEQALPYIPPVIEPPPVIGKPLGLDSPPVLPPQFPVAAGTESLADPEAFGETTVAESQSRTQPRVPLADPMSAVDPAVIHIEANQDPNDVLSLQTVLRSARPWFVSCALNTLVVLLLALIPILVISEEEFLLELPPIESSGEEYELKVIDEAQLTEKEVDVSLPIVAPVEKLEESAVQIAPLDLTHLEIPLPTELETPTFGAMLSGRQQGKKEQLLAAYGGSAETEQAVLAGLAWLHRHQDSDGMWSLRGLPSTIATKRARYSHGGEIENRCVATAMAMLAFQGYGQTHQDGPNAHFRRGLAGALEALLQWQDPEGSFTKQVPPQQRLYTQAFCTLALCELYTMSKDAKLRGPAKRAVGYLVANQDAAGGWKYEPGNGSDLSVSGWVMMALQSARMGGIDVPKSTLYRLEEFLDRVAVSGGSRYAYAPGDRGKLTMTAEGLLCRQYLGWSRDNEHLLRGAQILSDHGIKMSGTSQNFYYWYYATQVLHNIEGELWEQWNAVMSQVLPSRQVKQGSERGSWSPRRDVWGQRGGRLYTTALAIYMLEVYYRHLPIYTVDITSR